MNSLKTSSELCYPGPEITSERIFFLVFLVHSPNTVCPNTINLKTGNYTICPYTARQIERVEKRQNST